MGALAAGAFSVDTRSLYTAATEYDAAAGRLAAVEERVRHLQRMLLGMTDPPWELAGAVTVLGDGVRSAVDSAHDVADRLRRVAFMYEAVDLAAERLVAVAAGDTATVAQIDERYRDLMARDPGAERDPLWEVVLRSMAGAGDLTAQNRRTGLGIGALAGPAPALALGGLAAFGTLAATAIVGAGRRGLIERGTRLTGPAPTVGVRPRIPSLIPDPAPAGLAAATERIPTGNAQVRVERYTMPDGSRQFVVYVGGTRTAANGGSEPWDMKSNSELYDGRRSASSEATAKALREAGAEPGDAVHAIGYSQGAIVTSYLAMDSEYDVRTLVTVGPPVQAEVPDTTLNVSLQHTDDPFVALAGGGAPGSPGAPGSGVIEREADPAAGPRDFSIPAHDLDLYTETAEQAERNGDRGAAAVGEVFEELAQAESVATYEYVAERLARANGRRAADGE